MTARDVSLRGVGKRYGAVAALSDVDLVVAPGEFCTLLGPSGSGKTTLLKLIAGFEEPSAGAIAVGGRPMAGVPVGRRNIGVVFQNYALFPHMTAAANVAFPLDMRGVPRAEAARRAEAILATVGLEDLGGRLPRELSGGQQQRVALARALVFEPDLLLMDEPLGALDRNLRSAIQRELRRLHRALGVTVIYVTHDQEEALFLSDRIVVMQGGRAVQAGTPEGIYGRPATAFVARFLGDCNLIPARVAAPDGPGRIRAALEGGGEVALDWSGDASLLVGCRPERCRLVAPGTPAATPVRVNDAAFTGAQRRVLLDHPAGEMTVLVDPSAPVPAPGALAGLLLDAAHCFGLGS